MKTGPSFPKSNDIPSLIPGINRKPRQGWQEAFRETITESDERLLLDPAPNQFDAEEWRW